MTPRRWLLAALWLALYALLCVVAPEPDTTPPVAADAPGAR